MLRNTSDLSPANHKMLETLLQNRLGLKYMESKKLVAKGRENLKMEPGTPWNAELESECLKLYEAEHGPIQPRDYSTPEKSARPETPKKFTPSTPAPPKPVLESREPETPPAAEDTPELTPEEPTPEEEEEEAPAPEPEKEEEPAPEPKKEEEPEKEEEPNKALSDGEDASDEE